MVLRGPLHPWIANWHTHRTQAVVIEGEQSSEQAVISGVPQGTMLSPLMFLLYITDINNQITSPMRLFADDCILYRVINNPQDALALQTDLDKFATFNRKSIHRIRQFIESGNS